MLSARTRAILVVEDEPLVAMDIADCVQAAGFGVVGPAATLEEASDHVLSGVFDAALVDANLGGRKVDSLAAALTARLKPFAFVTGYGRETLPAGFRHVQVVAKPFTHDQLITVIVSLLRQTD